MTDDSDTTSTEETHSLLSRAQAGDPRDFDGLFGRHRAALHRAVARRLGPSLRGGSIPPTWSNEALGEFRVVREISRGGMGIVYEAERVLRRLRVSYVCAAQSDPGNPPRPSSPTA